MSQGVLMFAHNNSHIDYLRSAVVNATQVQYHMDRDVMIVSDADTVASYHKQHGEIPSNIQVHMVTPPTATNNRIYRNTQNHNQVLDFRNSGRANAYDISPWDETLLIDVDLLVLGDTLNQCWWSSQPFMINHDYVDAQCGRTMPGTLRLNPAGIHHYWATQIYFRKSSEAQMFFTLAQYAQQNYQHLRHVYQWSGTMLRNDFVFSIAAHMYSGYSGVPVPELPVKLYNTFDVDTVIRVLDTDSVLLGLEHPLDPRDVLLLRWRHNNIHIMNKWALATVCQELDQIHRQTADISV